jgi:hypothetical protein
MKILRRILKHHNMTSRQWKQLKRQQARILERQIDYFRLGCYFTPGHKYIDKIARLVKDLRVALQVKNWGN